MSLGPVGPFTAAPVAPSQGAGNQALPPRAGHQSAPSLGGKHKPQAQKTRKEKKQGESWQIWTHREARTEGHATGADYVPCVGVEAPT